MFRMVDLEHGRAKKCVGRSPLGHEKGAFGHGKGAFGVRKGHAGNFEQGLGAMGRPKSKMLIFHWFHNGFCVFRRVDLEHGRAKFGVGKSLSTWA